MTTHPDSGTVKSGTCDKCSGYTVAALGSRPVNPPVERDHVFHGGEWWCLKCYPELQDVTKPTCVSCKFYNPGNKIVHGSMAGEIIGECESAGTDNRMAMKSTMPCDGKCYSPK